MPLRPPISAPKTDREFAAWCRDTFDTRFLSGTGDPNGRYMGNRGQVFLRDDTGDIYKKTTDSVKTGWVAL
jgi:hypothetical protein